MHELEPYYMWRNHYEAEKDENSPFFGAEHNEIAYDRSIYNYLIHPQWDEIGSNTLYIKVLFVDYDQEFTIIELFGEWNDCINNDIMLLKRNVIDPMIRSGIHKFILIGENVLNFHGSDDCYYEEWHEDVLEEDGWISCINFRDHVVDEMRSQDIHEFFALTENYREVAWRPLEPKLLFYAIEQSRRLILGE